MKTKSSNGRTCSELQRLVRGQQGILSRHDERNHAEKSMGRRVSLWI